MNEGQIVGLIAVAGYLVLAISALRSHRLSVNRTLLFAGFWAGIFAIVILFIDIIR